MRLRPDTLDQQNVEPFEGAVAMASDAGAPIAVVGKVGDRGRLCLVNPDSLGPCAPLPYVPTGVGADSKGNVYVADGARGTVTTYGRRSGEFVARPPVEVGQGASGNIIVHGGITLRGRGARRGVGRRRPARRCRAAADDARPHRRGRHRHGLRPAAGRRTGRGDPGRRRRGGAAARRRRDTAVLRIGGGRPRLRRRRRRPLDRAPRRGDRREPAARRRSRRWWRRR